MTQTDATDTSPLLHAIVNLSTFHREHEKFYASAPREQAVALQRHARTLHALAEPGPPPTPSTGRRSAPTRAPRTSTADAALQLDGVLFMEGEGRPAEITRLIRDLRTAAQDQRATGEWLATAMQASWDMAAGAARDRRPRRPARRAAPHHRQRLAGRQHEHASRAAARARRRHPRRRRLHARRAPRRPRRPGPSTGRLYSAAEMIDHAADSASDSAGLVHDNERRWRTFRQRVNTLIATAAAKAQADPADSDPEQRHAGSTATNPGVDDSHMGADVGRTPAR